MSDTKKDIAIPLPSPPGEARILRIEGDENGPKEAQVGALLPLREGQPIPPGADMVELKPGRGGKHYDVTTHYQAPKPPQASGTAHKPMAVSREVFEANWDRIFGKKDKTPEPEPVVQHDEPLDDGVILMPAIDE